MASLRWLCLSLLWFMVSGISEGDGYAIKLQLAYFTIDGDGVPECPKFKSDTVFFEFQMQNTTFEFVTKVDRERRNIFFGRNLSSTQPNQLVFEGPRKKFFKPQPKVYVSLGYEKSGKRHYIITKRLVEIPIYTEDNKTEMARLSIRCTRLGFFYQPYDTPTPRRVNTPNKNEGVTKIRDMNLSNVTRMLLQRSQSTGDRLFHFVMWASSFFTDYFEP